VLGYQSLHMVDLQKVMCPTDRGGTGGVNVELNMAELIGDAKYKPHIVTFLRSTNLLTTVKFSVVSGTGTMWKEGVKTVTLDYLASRRLSTFDNEERPSPSPVPAPSRLPAPFLVLAFVAGPTPFPPAAPCRAGAAPIAGAHNTSEEGLDDVGEWRYHDHTTPPWRPGAHWAQASDHGCNSAGRAGDAQQVQLHVHGRDRLRLQQQPADAK